MQTGTSVNEVESQRSQNNKNDSDNVDGRDVRINIEKSPNNIKTGSAGSQTPPIIVTSTHYLAASGISGYNNIDNDTTLEDIKRPPSMTFPLVSSPSLEEKLSENQTHCPLCGKSLPDNSLTIPLRKLKPRFLRHVRKTSSKPLNDLSTRVCMKDLHSMLQSRIDDLLTEEQKDFARLQEDAMKFLHEHEKEADHWQDQFERRRSFPEKSADSVAKYAGSWKFVIACLSFLALWAVINLALGENGWDEYPFILLNLFLSILAALQGPVIMMSQNRQSALDKLQGDYISRIILRGEAQQRHCNAKVDYLMTNQWKRLLEIQEIQIDFLQMSLQKRKKSSYGMGPLSAAPLTVAQDSLGVPHSPSFGISPMVENEISNPTTTSWSLEIDPDDHTRMLLRHYFGTQSYDDNLLFSHWTEQGDNFFAEVHQVHLEIEELESSKAKSRGFLEIGKGGCTRAPQVLRRISYELQFSPDTTVTLDDVFAGDGIVKLRNDFDIPHMNMTGRIQSVEIYYKDKTAAAYTNGDLPTRYKPSFSNSFSRNERITPFWQSAIEKLCITYCPPHQIIVVSIEEGWTVRDLMVDFQRPDDNLFDHTVNQTSVFETELLMATTTAEEFIDPLTLLKSLSESKFGSEWKQIAKVEFDEKAKSVDGDIVTVFLEDVVLTGPNVYVFWSGDCETVLRGIYEEEEN